MSINTRLIKKIINDILKNYIKSFKLWEQSNNNSLISELEKKVKEDPNNFIKIEQTSNTSTTEYKLIVSHNIVKVPDRHYNDHGWNIIDSIPITIILTKSPEDYWHIDISAEYLDEDDEVKDNAELEDIAISANWFYVGDKLLTTFSDFSEIIENFNEAEDLDSAANDNDDWHHD